MSVYLDASVLVALFTNDPLTARADTFLRANPLVLIVSDFAAAEFSSVIARHVRTKEITKNDARIVFSNFDTWTASTTQHAVIDGADIIAAEVLLRRQIRKPFWFLCQTRFTMLAQSFATFVNLKSGPLYGRGSRARKRRRFGTTASWQMRSRGSRRGSWRMS